MGKLGAGQCARAQPEPLKSSRGASRPVSIESSHSELLCSTRYALYGIYEYVVSSSFVHMCHTGTVVSRQLARDSEDDGSLSLFDTSSCRTCLKGRTCESSTSSMHGQCRSQAMNPRLQTQSLSYPPRHTATGTKVAIRPHVLGPMNGFLRLRLLRLRNGRRAS